MIPAFFETMFLWVGRNFSPEAYLLVTKIQGLLWSGADVILIFCILKITDVVLAHNQQRPVRVRYWLLLLSVLPIPLLLFVSRGSHFFLIECVIFGLQFSILIYTIVVHIRDIMIFFRRIVENATV